MKQFQGIISNWRKEPSLFDDGVYIVVGKCDYHKTFPEWATSPFDEMHTSRVIEIQEIKEGMYMCETKNSFYLLLGKEKEGNHAR